MDDIKIKIRDWSVKHAHGPKATFWLSVLSFSEASFFPIPPDVILIAILLTKERVKWFFYSLVTTLSSVAGGIFGYIIGAIFFSVFGEAIVSFYGLEEQLVTVSHQFNQHVFLTMFIAAFTPIPYKVFTIAAGLLYAPIFVFVLASLLGRGIRFFTIGYILKKYGEKISGVLYTYFNIISILLIALVALFIYFLF